MHITLAAGDSQLVHSDEDMLGEMARDPMGESVFSISMWDRVFQLILRLKGNTVIVGTAGFPDEMSMQLAVSGHLDDFSSADVTMRSTTLQCSVQTRSSGLWACLIHLHIVVRRSSTCGT